MKHLSEEEFADLLAGELPGAAVQRHLLACAPCRNELEAVRWAMEDFDQRSLRWARAEAPRRVPTPSRLALRLGVRPSWALGLGALTAAAVMVCSLHTPAGQQHGPNAAAMAVSSAPVPTTTEMAQDNRLLESINAELSYQATPAGVLPGQADAAHQDQAGSKSTVIN